ncbi:MAG: hypothetical protein ACNI27_07235 [Desulfovibrio sp.]
MGTNRKPWHPKQPEGYNAPTSNKKGYIEGNKAVAGFGSADFYVALMPAREAREVVMKHHYSHRIVNNSFLHLGVWYKQNFCGVLQFGYALNVAAVGNIVEGSKQGDYLELNRMWLSDVAPRNSESMAISYAFKFIKRAIPSIAWVQSFADERCGCLGVVYQAANFLYAGSHKTNFYYLDGEYYHPMLLTAHKKCGQRGRVLKDNIDRALKLNYRQYRYIYFVKKSWRKKLKLKVQQYPKPESAR